MADDRERNGDVGKQSTMTTDNGDITIHGFIKVIWFQCKQSQWPTLEEINQ